MSILNSASRLAFLYLVGVLGILALFAGGWGVVNGTIEPKEILAIFGAAITMILTYYFTRDKGEQPPQA